MERKMAIFSKKKRSQITSLIKSFNNGLEKSLLNFLKKMV